jgi:hypothetical protein
VPAQEPYQKWNEWAVGYDRPRHLTDSGILSKEHSQQLPPKRQKQQDKNRYPSLSLSDSHC